MHDTEIRNLLQTIENHVHRTELKVDRLIQQDLDAAEVAKLTAKIEAETASLKAANKAAKDALPPSAT